MFQAKYKALQQEATLVEDLEKSPVTHPTVQKYSYSTWVMGFMLVVLSLLNMLHYMPPYSQVDKRQYNKTYTGQINDVPTVVVHDNRTIDDEMWTSDRYNMDYGIVALDDEYVHQRGLLPAQRYPWDPSKSIYLLQGYHAMHCVQIFRDLIMDVRDKKASSTWSHQHMVHCLHTLREEIECYGDRFPLYINIPSPEEEEKTTPGVGDTRMCRSWDGLRDFAIAHTACWSKKGWHKGDPIVDTYKRCPDGSEPWKDLELD